MGPPVPLVGGIGDIYVVSELFEETAETFVPVFDNQEVLVASELGKRVAVGLVVPVGLFGSPSEIRIRTFSLPATWRELFNSSLPFVIASARFV